MLVGAFFKVGGPSIKPELVLSFLGITEVRFGGWLVCGPTVLLMGLK